LLVGASDLGIAEARSRRIVDSEPERFSTSPLSAFSSQSRATWPKVTPVGARRVRVLTPRSASARQPFASASDLNVLRIFLSSRFE